MMTLSEAKRMYVTETYVDGVRHEAIGGAEVSPAASLVPWMTEEEFRELLESMDENGYDSKYPVLNDFGGQLVDGRHRFLATLVLELEPTWATAEHDDKTEVVIANLRRRNLSQSVKATTYLRLTSDGSDTTDEHDVPSQRERAAEAGVSRRTLQLAESVEKSTTATDELRSAISDGAITVDKADAIKDLPPEKQIEIVTQDSKAKIRKAASKAAAEAVTTRRERMFDIHKWKPKFDMWISGTLAAVPVDDRPACKQYMQETLGSTVHIERDTESQLTHLTIVKYIEEIIGGLPEDERTLCEAAIGKRYGGSKKSEVSKTEKKPKQGKKPVVSAG